MDDVITPYITSTYPIELAGRMDEAFSILREFNYPELEAPYIDLIMNEEFMGDDALQDAVYQTLVNQLDVVISHYLIDVNKEEISFNQRVEILQTLDLIYHSLDYDDIIMVLESTPDATDAFKTIISNLSTLSISDLDVVILEVSPWAAISLKNHIYQTSPDILDPNHRYSVEERAVVQRIKDFKTYSAQKDPNADIPLGCLFLENCVLAAQSFERYLPYIKGMFEGTDYRRLGLDILSLILLSKQSLNPIDCYREYARSFFDDLSSISRVEVAITYWLGEFNHYESHLKTMRAKA